jgi:hypothetical protein
MEQFCLTKIYKSELADVEAFSQLISAKTVLLEQQLWKLFAELMDADCLNSQQQDQFLPMKNKVQLKMVQDPKAAAKVTPFGDVEPSIAEQLKEAFADLVHSKLPKAPVEVKPEILKKPFKKGFPVKTITEQLQGVRDI